MRRVHSISRIAACAAVAGMFGWTSPSSAYRMIQVPNWGRYLSSTPVTCDNTGGFAHWYTTSIPWRVTSSDSGRIAAVQAALNAWTAVPGASHVLSYAGTIGVDPFLLYAGDGINQIYWGGDPGGWCTGSCLAITALEIQNDQTIVESDILFNNAHPWSTSGGTYDIQTVATHELGHSLGIHHTEVTSTPRPTMYAGYFGTDGRSLENDDVQALQCSEDWYVSPAYEGLHETTTCREVKGWARNAKRSNGYARVKVWNNNVSWREVLANEYRPDVGYHGWTTT
ncbi:MAG TPA: matrixin family metalloprotease, partial [Gemmatimonadales bacterium]|nr:matrixin family metalloprotease [Gemmatimonadales bacterium]